MKQVVTIAFLVATLVVSGCRKEPVEVLPEYETGELAARVNDFQVYPGAKFLADRTEGLRKAHFVLHPSAKTAPPMAMYVTDDPLEDVARFYAEKAGWSTIAPNPADGFTVSSVRAYYRAGDLKADAEALGPLLAKLGITSDLSKVSGRYRMAHIDGNGPLPRVDVQRPWLDLQTGEVREETMIVMVRDE